MLKLKLTQPNLTHACLKIIGPNPTQTDPTHGSTQPMSTSGMAYHSEDYIQDFKTYIKKTIAK